MNGHHYSPDVNPLDYSTWDIMQDLVYEGRQLQFANLQDLKEAIKNKWKEVTTESSKTHCAIENRLNAVRKKNGGAIQQIFR